jgi:hypothetical protein
MDRVSEGHVQSKPGRRTEEARDIKRQKYSKRNASKRQMTEKTICKDKDTR